VGARRLLPILVVSLLAACDAAGDNPAPLPNASAAVSDSDRAYYQHLEMLKDTAPAQYEYLQTFMLITAQKTLGRLGYGPTPFTLELDRGMTRAIRQYEKARGIPVTGNLFTAATLKHITQDAALLAQADASTAPPQRLFVGSLWDRGWVEASGAWVMDGERNTGQALVSVRCQRDRLECVLVTSRSGMLSRVDGETYEIARWDRAEIVSKPYDYPCARYILRLNRVQESVSQTRTTISGSGTCSFMEKRDIVSRLADDSLLWKEHFRLQAAEESLLAFTPGARVKLKKLRSGSR